MSHLVCFGLGFSARAIAQNLVRRGWTITATSRSHSGADAIAALGYEAHVFDGTTHDHALADALSRATHVLVSAPPNPVDPVLAHYASDLAASRSATWIGYLSTIGVYGDTGGAWIDETSPVRPSSDRSQRRAHAEAAWLALAAASNKRALIFRLAGIYGPGRSAIDNLREGSARRIIKPGQVFNRIHRDDIAGLVLAAIDRTPSHAIYNVTDDEPAPPQDVIAYGASLLGLPIPPDTAYETAQLSSMAQSFYSENKRVSNARAKADLGWQLRYPTYREGLKAIATL